jgi:hypothetical protein
MFRGLRALGFLFGAVILLGGSVVWFRSSLDQAFDRGRLIGEAAVRQAYEAELEKRRIASEAALVKAQRDVAELERARDRARDQFDEVLDKVGRNPDRGNVCLDLDVVRALGRIGRDPPDDRRDP